MTLLEFFYYIGYSLDKRYKLKHQKRLPHKVISIGNITVGGTGKTPATIAIAEEAKKRGFQPIILTRGYRGKAKGPCLVKIAPGINRSDKSKSKVQNSNQNSSPVTHRSSLLFGDEPVLMAERLKDVPVVKCSDRYEGGIFALSSLQRSNTPFLFILDDGFQHWKLYRDIDIVLINGLNPFGSRRILPVGPLREPLDELKRADIFVVTNASINKGKIKGMLLDELRNINPDAPIYFSEYRIKRLKDIKGDEHPIDILKDRRVYSFCGIANPDSFRQTVLSISGELVGFKTYRDHHYYSLKDMVYLMKQGRYVNSDFLLTTEKDMVKIKEIRDLRFNIQNENILSLQIDFSVEPEFFETVFRNIP